MILSIVFSAAYLAVSCMFLRFILVTQERMRNSNMGRRHPEMFREPLWLTVLVSLLWPLQIIGFIVYLARGY